MTPYCYTRTKANCLIPCTTELVKRVPVSGDFWIRLCGERTNLSKFATTSVARRKKTCRCNSDSSALTRRGRRSFYFVNSLIRGESQKLSETLSSQKSAGSCLKFVQRSLTPSRAYITRIRCSLCECMCVFFLAPF